MSSRICVTGGAGYIGTTLVPLLLRAGHGVTVLDSLRHGQTVLLDVVHDPAFRFVRGDVRDRWAVDEALDGADAVVHLAAIVGAPACHADPVLARSINVDGTAAVVEAAGGRPVIFASTDSCYGSKGGGSCDEGTALEPISEYGQHKLLGEIAVRQAPDFTILRFATAFGASPRMRLDLLVNDLTFTAVRTRAVVVYEAGFKRTFLHVRDIARALLVALDNRPRWRWQVVNVGDDRHNVSKAVLAGRIAAAVPGCLLNLAGAGADPDRRDATVSHALARSLGFEAEVSIDDGIAELVKAAPLVVVHNPFSNVERA